LPVELVTLSPGTANPQQQQDLQKIYADALPQPSADQVNATLAQQKIYAGLFNARLLGALVSHSEPDDGNSDGYQETWSCLCVRQVTRRRGVARRLLELALLQLPPATRVRFDTADTPDIQPYLLQLNFQQEEDHIFSHTTPG